MEPAIDLTVTTTGATATIELGGVVDATNFQGLREATETAFAEGASSVTYDVGRLTFMDSSCLGVLGYALKQARLRGGVVRVANPSPLVRRVLEVTGMDGEVGLA